MDSKLFAGLISAFIVVVIGLALLSSSADTISTTTDIYSGRTLEALINATAVEIIDDDGWDLVGVSAVEIGSKVCNVTTNYVVSTAANTINLTGTNCPTGTYNVTYTYRTDNYVSDGASRTLMGLIIIFFALAVAFGAWGLVGKGDFGF